METEIINKIQEGFANAEEHVIKTVLKELLKKDPTIEDFKNVSILRFEGVFEYYFLAYNNLKLGKIYRDFNLTGDNKMTVRFVPCEMDEFLEKAVINNKLNF